MRNWFNKPKDEVSGATEGRRYFKYAVALQDHIDEPVKSQGMEFEIVPLRDPGKLKAGDKLEVLVLFRRKPAANTVVIPDYVTDSENRSIRTDTNGKAVITIRNQGLNVIAAMINEELNNDPKADEISCFTILSFSLHYHNH